MTKQFLHIDEQTLSLYVLNDPSIEAKRNDITFHLSECEGCKALYEQITSFYALTESEIEHNALLGKRHNQELMKRQSLSPVWSEKISSVVQKTPIVFPAQLWYFVKRRPILSSGATFSFVALLIFGINFLMHSPKDDNPAYFTFHNHKMQIHNFSGEILWEKLLSDRLKSEENNEISKAVTLIDMNNDGKNDIVTIFNDMRDEKSSSNSVTMYNTDGTILWRTNLGREVSGYGQIYANDFFTHKMLIHTYKGEPSIFVSITNTHSPSAIIILNTSGNIVAEYWNYGHFSDFIFADVNDDGTDELVATCFTDESDTPIIVALDVEQIGGISQSRYSNFNGVAKSVAEIYRAELKQNQKFFQHRSYFWGMKKLPDNKLRLYFGEEPEWLFTCIVGKELHCESVLSTDKAIEKYGKKNAEQRAENLKNSIKYLKNMRGIPPA